jgi:hypothetical protein
VQTFRFDGQTYKELAGEENSPTAPAGVPIASTSPSRPSEPDAKSEIVSLLERWRQSVLSGAADTLANCYAPTVELYFRRKNVDQEDLRKMQQGEERQRLTFLERRKVGKSFVSKNSRCTGSRRTR